MKTLVVDAYDSFVHIIAQYLLDLDAGPRVVRADRIDPDAVAADPPDLLVLGPGPGHPADSGEVELVHRFAGVVPILGVCLGHQAVAAAYGATVRPARHLMHGKTSVIRHDGRGCFAGRPADTFTATRYHSLIVEPDSLPAELEVSAWSDDDGYVMGLRHRTLPIESVQFHPESVRTDDGHAVFRSFIAAHVPAAAT
ncbi:anthranilate synthase component II [Spirilliplanes yamanashiensis]|uniref:Glutamine amidotransferase n=1 Tax=Spirilliplanes yamanashiensis TaxID=42233 RepID=A0A8J4DI80_9ACTN|nr:aminodeoxychorismate/anthranilate synthase component II [Spirilliplanes yamanashiensis]MDP9819289.1 anthranilate synthase component 2 [Spirilliplanes yamanashiensis]GIJ01888.1 glutamine amidotransferase [Spirilliplanes yamanashiensis]